MSLMFYTNPFSRGRIVRWMLEETGADYETTIVEFSEIPSSGYLDVNPMGKVPAIVHNGKTVTECAAICAYLADAFPDAGLAPSLDSRADYYRWLFFAAGPLEQAITNESLGFKPSPEQEATAGYGNFARTVSALETAFAGQSFITGEQFTAADVYVGSQIIWGLQFKTLPANDTFEAYAARLRSRDAYLRASEIDGPMG